MKGNLTKRLISYFAGVLLAFAIVIGLLFSILFTSTMADHNRSDLENRADVLASTLSGFLEGGSLSSSDGQARGKGQGRGGFGAFLKLADEMAMGEVWLVDKDSGLITKGEHDATDKLDTLPPDGVRLINDALTGKTGLSESFSEALGKQSITVCVPAYGSGGEVLAAVLLHAPVDSMRESLQAGLWILLISLAAASVLSILAAILLSRRFVRPIKAISHTAARLAEGDYQEKTEIRQADEIGCLAETMDVLSARLLAAQNQRERLEKEQQAFYADISHELRTPVTVIRGSLEALRDGKVHDTEKKNEYYDQMIAEAEYMQKMVNDLLDLSKLRNMEYVMEKEPVNLSDILSDVARSIRRIAEKKQVEVAYDNPYEVIGIDGSYEKLRQMFLTVLDNAVKFSPPGEQVLMQVKKEKGAFSISIFDHGPGIDEKDLPHIFERFYKQVSQQNTCGTGIGLAIAKEIADRHSIRIETRSGIGQGTCFSFQLR